MKYIMNFENFNSEELLLEKINFGNLLNVFKNSIDKKKIAIILVSSLLSVFTISQVYNIIDDLKLKYEEKKILVDVASKFKDPLDLRLSSSGWNFIKEHEKLRLKAYAIGDGMITVGYGHAKPEKKSKYKVGDRITKEEAQRLLILDVNFAAQGVRRMFSQWKDQGIDIKLTQNQYDVLVSMAYNMGITGFRKTKFVQELKKNNIAKACELIKKTGIRKGFSGLIHRRALKYEKFKS